MSSLEVEPQSLAAGSTRSGVASVTHPARIGHYKILGVANAGILTTVYRAEAEGIARTVILKVLRSTAGRESSFFRRFEREARLLASLRHPNLIELFDFDAGAPGERPPHMVLEYVDGATLAEILQRTSRLEPDEAAAITLETARALAYAHTQGVVHRDVKPGNVLLGRIPGERMAVKLVDFGIAQDSPRMSADEGDGSDSMGTPAYMAPEQLLGEAIDHRADQFALGIVLFQMLAGVRPFDGDDGRPAIQRVRRDPPRTFKSLGLDVPRALERVVLRCLAKRPTDRFESTSEIVEELTRFLEQRVASISDLAPLHRRVLARAGVLDERRALREETAESSRPARSSPIRVRSVPLAPTVVGIALALVAMGAGGAAIQWRNAGARKQQEAPRPPPPSSLETGEGGDFGRLRVLVRPWAEVIIDGEKVDTTPMARTIRLRPGRHVVILQHPAAKERRVVEIRTGEVLTLDVVLPVFAPAHADEFLPPATSAAPSSSVTAKPPVSPIPSTLNAGGK